MTLAAEVQRRVYYNYGMRPSGDSFSWFTARNFAYKAVLQVAAGAGVGGQSTLLLVPRRVVRVVILILVDVVPCECFQYFLCAY